MKERIMLFYRYLKNASTEEDVARKMQELERYLKEKLLRSFLNGLEAGRKKKVFRRRK